LNILFKEFDDEEKEEEGGKGENALIKANAWRTNERMHNDRLN
jgi:hypothetical protein